MAYSQICDDEYYFLWDSDLIPVKTIYMFDDFGKPFFDMKTEYHEPYFETLSRILPGLGKGEGIKSYISEHMLIKTDYMRMLIKEIERNTNIEGMLFWEKIIDSININDLCHSGFSEYETYGTFVTDRFKDFYQFREWHSIRNGGAFFKENEISASDVSWTAKYYDAITFEKFSVYKKSKNFIAKNKIIQYFVNPKIIFRERFFICLNDIVNEE